MKIVLLTAVVGLVIIGAGWLMDVVGERQERKSWERARRIAESRR